MSFRCKIGFHSWNSCKCQSCGTVRNRAHRWEGCRCTVCSKTRDQEHDWSGCTCRLCKQRRDEGHRLDGCTCRICGETFHAFDQDPASCSVCGFLRPIDDCFVDLSLTMCDALRIRAIVRGYDPASSILFISDFLALIVNDPTLAETPQAMKLRTISRAIRQHYNEDAISKAKVYTSKVLAGAIKLAALKPFLLHGGVGRPIAHVQFRSDDQLELSLNRGSYDHESFTQALTSSMRTFMRDRDIIGTPGRSTDCDLTPKLSRTIELVLSNRFLA